jgi:hypothetical protein
MTIAKKDLHAALTCLAERFPQTFVKHTSRIGR